MKVLVVEDEKKAAQHIKTGLTQNGFIVDIADNGIDGLFLAQEHKYDLIILDIMLPKLDGWEVLSRIREKNKLIPVILLTARDDVEDKVHGLNLGADDYLAKPFAFSELLARAQALLRRGKQQQIAVIEVDNLAIDFLKHKVTRNGKHIDLSPKEFALLALFMKRQGDMLTRAIIAEQIWDMNFDSDTNVIDVVVKRLRDKIGDSSDHRLIHTIRGLGYVFELRETT